jgi:hypothetical protein
MFRLDVRDWVRENPILPHLLLADDGSLSLLGAGPQLITRPSWFRGRTIEGRELTDVVQPDGTLRFGEGQRYRPVREMEQGHVLYERIDSDG